MSHPELSGKDMKEFMEKSLTQMCQQLTNVVDDRFAHLKRGLSADNSATLETFTNKKARLEKPQFKSKGNEQQYNHQLGVLDTVESATTALEHQDIDKAISFLQEGKVAIEARMKLIKLADTSDHGWQTVAEYMTNELADNSDDEKRIDRAEKTAEKKAKKAKASKTSKSRPFQGYPNRIPYRNSMASRRPVFPDHNGPSGNAIGPCYKLSVASMYIALCFVLESQHYRSTAVIRLLCSYLERLSSNKHKVLQATC
ncbi:Hypothetical predicted protein [Paramuricea clavata]|uniref:Uncharacterized protein n=1 Tax=Paramuricea clavata TaxID=317549 RepID=A0A6S7JEZ5_PARCT|nr:Hypothetical predicted protein [Paramuricea clavata]